MSKLGLHINAIMPQVKELIRNSRPTIIKTLQHDPNYFRELHSLSPNSFFVGRIYLHETEQQLNNPRARAISLANKVIPIASQTRDIYDCWEGYNEKGVTKDEARLYNEFAVYFAEAMHAEGFKVAAYSFATGNPELDVWPLLLDGLRKSDYLALHEYSAPSMRWSEGWLCLRYRKVYDLLPVDCRKPLIITETGIDGGVRGQINVGWQGFVSAEQYMADLAWYDSEISGDPYVIGATIYCSGTIDQTWKSFDILVPKMQDLLTSYWNKSRPVYFSGYSIPKIGAKMFKADFPTATIRPAHPKNYNGNFKGPPRIIVLHGTAGSYDAACNWFTKPPGDGPNARGRMSNGDLYGPSSAHYVIGYNGQIAQCVPEGMIAWHAGKSRLGNLNDINPYSIGIEIETDTKGFNPWNFAKQMLALEGLVVYLLRKYKISLPGYLTTHKIISLSGKIDPINFPLDEFRRRVFSLAYPQAPTPAPTPAPVPAPKKPRPARLQDPKKYGGPV